MSALALLGQIITLNFTSYDINGLRIEAFWNLTIKGVVGLSDRGLSIAKQDFYQFYSYVGYNPYQYLFYQYEPNILIVSWGKTFSRLMDALGGQHAITSYVLASVDRDRLVNTYDLQGTMGALSMLYARVQNSASQHNAYVQALILYALSSYQFQLMSLMIAIVGVAALIFLLVWYMGGTGSQVSFNLRRREIGLLSARGFTRRNIMRLFLTEAIMIGVISGLIGFLIGVLIVPLTFGQAIPAGMQGLEYVFRTAGIQTAAMAIVVGVLLAVFTVYRAAGKASSMKTVDALKEYTYVEETSKPFRSKTVWLAFILGTYKMIAWIIGFNFYSLIYSLSSNIVLYILFAIFMSIDGILGVLAPILFLYGTVKLVTQGSIRLQRKVGSVGKRVFGDSGVLATKYVQRNPARNVAVAFLVALIVGYGMMAIGATASNYDYQYRQIYANVGADASTYLVPGSNVTYLSGQVANISGVSAVTFQSYLNPSASAGTLPLRGVDPTKWLEVAYYEEGWFRGTSAQQAFQSMEKDNFTIVLDSGVADYLSLHINDTISITFSTLQGQHAYSFRVVGFFGPKPVQTYVGYTPYFYSTYWSYVPAAALNKINATSTNDQLLIRLSQGANATFTVQEINRIQNTTNTLSANAQLESIYSNYILTGPQDVLNIGIALALVAASLEIVVIVTITLFERKKELTVLSVRGMSSRQISSILLIEMLSIVGFALALGIVVGLIIVIGTVSSTYSSGLLVTQRVVFPLSSILLIVAMLGLILIAVVIPIMVAAGRAPSNARKKGGW